jgi:hypothetical protein
MCCGSSVPGEKPIRWQHDSLRSTIETGGAAAHPARRANARRSGHQPRRGLADDDDQVSVERDDPVEEAHGPYPPVVAVAIRVDRRALGFNLPACYEARAAPGSALESVLAPTPS